MKNIQRCFAITILALGLTLSASGGEMSAPGITSSPSRPQSSVTGEMSAPGATATGDMSTPGTAELDPVTEAVLGLLQGLMSLF